MNLSVRIYRVWVVCLFAGRAFAQPLDGDPAPGGPQPGTRPPMYTWSVGAGIVYSSSPYVGNSPIVIPLPLVTYRGERLSVLGPFASYQVWASDRYTFSVRLGAEFEGYGEDEDERLEGLGDRDITLEAGGDLSVHFPGKLDLSLQLVREVTGEHEGWTFDASLSRTWRERGTFIIPSMYFKAHDERYTQYYFGVPVENARPDRPVYEPTESFRYGVGLMIRRPINDRWMWMARGDVMVLSHEITESPIVVDQMEWGLMAGASWQF